MFLFWQDLIVPALDQNCPDADPPMLVPDQASPAAMARRPSR